MWSLLHSNYLPSFSHVMKFLKNVFIISKTHGKYIFLTWSYYPRPSKLIYSRRSFLSSHRAKAITSYAMQARYSGCVSIAVFFADNNRVLTTRRRREKRGENREEETAAASLRRDGREGCCARCRRNFGKFMAATSANLGRRGREKHLNEGSGYRRERKRVPLPARLGRRRESRSSGNYCVTCTHPRRVSGCRNFAGRRRAPAATPTFPIVDLR